MIQSLQGCPAKRDNGDKTGKRRRAEVCQIRVQGRPFDNGDKKRNIHNVQRIRCPGDGAGGGVRRMRLVNKDELVGTDAVSPAKRPIFPKYGKQRLRQKTSVKNYRLQNRGGSGIKTFKVTEKTGPLMVVRIISARRRRAHRHIAER